ncbi:MAG: diguanylate cyclase [Pseudomonas sp.]|nr:diguanylate cyclase [Pseudomonas sp.]
MSTLLLNETINLLQELLEAERAGARLALDTLDEADDEQKGLLNKIHKGEAESCRRIRDCIKYLGGVPSLALGAFYEKAMKIEDVTDRLYFIDRGQRWVINKVKDNLQDIDNSFVRIELENVLKIHVLNSDAFNLIYT